MEFTSNQSIYLQISDKISERILRKEWTAGMRIPSIREIAVQMEVNPNTVVRSYNYLQEKGMIQNKRGIGYFISDAAYTTINNEMKTRFIDIEMPAIIKKMLLLDIDPKLFQTVWENERKEWKNA